MLDRRIKVRPGEPARVFRYKFDPGQPYRLGVFRYVNINVTPARLAPSGDNLDMEITAAMDVPMEAEFEADFSSNPTVS